MFRVYRLDVPQQGLEMLFVGRKLGRLDDVRFEDFAVDPRAAAAIRRPLDIHSLRRWRSPGGGDFGGIGRRTKRGTRTEEISEDRDQDPNGSNLTGDVHRFSRRQKNLQFTCELE